MTEAVLPIPIADRRASFQFYADGLGLDAVGEPAGDGLPEPPQFIVNEGVRLVLVPRGQAWGCVGAFADPDGHIWMVTSGTPRS